jgi:hypothetical protein
VLLVHVLNIGELVDGEGGFWASRLPKFTLPSLVIGLCFTLTSTSAATAWRFLVAVLEWCCPFSPILLPAVVGPTFDGLNPTLDLLKRDEPIGRKEGGAPALSQSRSGLLCVVLDDGETSLCLSGVDRRCWLDGGLKKKLEAIDAVALTPINH